MTKIEKLCARLHEAGLCVTWVDDPILEMEFDRKNETKFPSRYTILGLRIQPRRRVAWSIEPMFKPEQGDTTDDCWVNKTERRRERRKLKWILRHKIMPILKGLNLELGNEVGQIHNDSEVE